MAESDDRVWSSGATRKSWCDQKKPCRFCWDYINVTMKRGGGMKQSCVDRPKHLKCPRLGGRKDGSKTHPKKKKKFSAKNEDSEDSDEISEPPSDDDDDIKWIGKGDEREGGNIFYKKFVLQGQTYSVHDFAYLYGPYDSKARKQSIYLGQIRDMWQTPEDDYMVEVRWFFQKKELKKYLHGHQVDIDDREVFKSDTFDDNSIDTLEKPVLVKHKSQIEAEGLTIAEWKKKNPTGYFFHRWFSSGEFGSLPVRKQLRGVERQKTKERAEAPDSEISPYECFAFRNYALPVYEPPVSSLLSSSSSPPPLPSPPQVTEPPDSLVIAPLLPGSGSSLLISPKGGRGRPKKAAETASKQKEKESANGGQKLLKSDETTKAPDEKKVSLPALPPVPPPFLLGDLDQAAEENPHTMPPCRLYEYLPNKAVKEYPANAFVQPFRIEVSSNALIVIDTHCHLSHLESIGFLSGTFDEANQLLSIRGAYPCNAASEDELNVEVDVMDQIATFEAVEGMHQRIVGWYHSHPLFLPTPSLKDMANQKQHQNSAKLGHSAAPPFVGAICSTYDLRLPSSASCISWFHTVRGGGYRLSVSVVPEVPTSQEAAQLARLLIDGPSRPRPIDFNEIWRAEPVSSTTTSISSSCSASSSGIMREGTTEPKPIVTETKEVTKLEKLRFSLYSRLPASMTEAAKNEFLAKALRPLYSRRIESAPTKQGEPPVTFVMKDSAPPPPTVTEENPSESAVMDVL